MYRSQNFKAKTHVLRDKWIKMAKLMVTLRSCIYNERPDCSQVLSEYNEWSIDKSVVINDTEFDTTLNKLREYDNKFFVEFINYKLNH